MSQRADDHAVKRAKYDSQIPIIPSEAEWPPCSPKPVRKITAPKKDTPLKPNKKEMPLKPNKGKVSRDIKKYLNMRYDEFIATKQLNGTCTCQCERRNPIFKIVN